MITSDAGSRCPIVKRIDSLKLHRTVKQEVRITKEVWTPLPISKRKRKFERNCWAVALGGCDDLSKEHMISATVCEALGDSQLEVVIGKSGKRLPSNAIQQKIPCRKHNRMLSPFDQEAGILVAKIAEYHRGPSRMTSCIFRCAYSRQNCRKRMENRTMVSEDVSQSFHMDRFS